MTLLAAEKIQKIFRERKRITNALKDVSLYVERGEILGIAGESGSGKSTLARVITGIIPADSGLISFEDRIYHPDRERPPKWIRENIQMIFQNPTGSFHPRKTIGKTLVDAASNFHSGKSAEERRGIIEQYMLKCDLAPDYLNRYPHEISGGQCQRAGIVRALIANPKILILDEATSALDVLVQQGILDLLLGIRKETGMSMIFISHDLALLSNISDRIMIMKEGEVVEEGCTEELLAEPGKVYTRQLLESVL